jgi:HlyD family secretion protein
MRLRSIALPCLLVLATIRVVTAAPQATGPIEDVFSPTVGDSRVLYIVPEGSKVTKGQLICLLDQGGSRSSIEHQQTTIRQAETAYQQAKLSREVAEVAVHEYEEGTYKQQLETVNGDIALAQADLQRTRDRLEWAQRMREKQYISPAQELSDRLAMNKAKYTLEQTNTSKKVLLEFTKEKTIKQLRAEVEKARAEELSRQATYELAKTKGNGLRRQVKNVQILAPIDGSVRLARPTRLVEEGAAVCEGQLLLRIVPDLKGTPTTP